MEAESQRRKKRLVSCSRHATLLNSERDMGKVGRALTMSAMSGSSGLGSAMSC